MFVRHCGYEIAGDSKANLLTDMDSLCDDVRSMANHARRNMVIPTDFELSLDAFNVNLTHLKKHRRNAIPPDSIKGPEVADEDKRKADETPEAHRERMASKGFAELPILDTKLSGDAEKEAKPYIPTGFPAFPSKHTYQHTLVDIESVTVKAPIHEQPAGTKATTQPTPDWRGDPEKIREAAAVQAKQAEEALRKLVRASKMASLKDLRSTAEKNPTSKVRYELWEEAMKSMLRKKGGKDGGGAAREDVADHSMVVNAQKKYHRREIPRSAKSRSHDHRNGGK